jgi:CIC family chloride channel protein
MSKLRILLAKFLKWRVKHLSDKRFLILLSILIGITGGVAASIMKTIIILIEENIHEGILKGYQNALYFILPAIGIMASMLLIKYIFKTKLPEGVPLVLYCIGKNNSVIQRVHMYAHVVTSSITVAFGGSVGLEGPSVATGSAIGSNIGQLFHLNQKRKALLIGCGSAAAISALFNAPVAAVIFVFEIILVELKTAFIIPLLMSSVSASMVSRGLMGDAILFDFGSVAAVEYRDIPFYILLGLATGFLAMYFMRISEWLGKIGQRSQSYWGKYIMYGALLGAVLFILPTLYGEGYYTIRQLLKHQDSTLLTSSIYSFIPFLKDAVHEQWFLILFLTVSVLMKVFATNFTRMAGGTGGVFAPSLFIGGVTGFIISRTVNLLNSSFQLPENNFTLVGMSGVVAGIMHAPLTAMFLIAEITGGYELFLPLMIVVAISYGTTSKYSKYSYYTKKLALKGDLVAHDRDKTLLHDIGVLRVIEKDLVTVPEEGKLKDLVDAISKSHRNIFPVVSENEELKGIILLDDVRHLIFKPEKYDVDIKFLMHPPPAYVTCDELLDTVMDKFDNTNAWNLPVIKDGKYYGFLSKSKIFSVYRDRLSSSNDLEF